MVSYNIKSGHLAGSLSRIAQLLRDSGADVVFMQEVDQRRFASGRVDQPAFFADALDVSYAYGKNAPYPGGGGIGNLILSRFGPISKAKAYVRYRDACGRDQRVRALWGSDAPFVGG